MRATLLSISLSLALPMAVAASAPSAADAVVAHRAQLRAGWSRIGKPFADARSDTVIPVEDGDYVGFSRSITTGMVGSPAISADGRVIAFALTDAAGGHDIWLHKEGSLTRLTSDGTPKLRPRLSGDGAVVVWSQKIKTDGRDDFDPMMWKDGVVTDLMNDRNHSLDVEVSADGRLVLWDRDREGTGVDWDIWSWRAGTVTPFVEAPGDQSFTTISGDAGTVVYSDYSQSADPVTARLMRWSAGEAALVSPAELRSQIQPGLTHDGRTIFYSVNAGDFRMDIVRAREGEAPEAIVTGPGLKQGLSCSADGSVLAYMAVPKPGAGWDVLLRERGHTRPVAVLDGHQISPELDASGHAGVWMDAFVSGEDTHQIYRFRWAAPPRTARR